MFRSIDWLWTVDGRVSVARCQLLVVLVYLLLWTYLLPFQFMLTKPSRLAYPLSAFVIAIIIATAGAAALPLETHLVRLPARLRRWAVESGRGAGLSQPRHSDGRASLSLLGDQGRVDLAVLQLAFVVLLIPILSTSELFASVRWRLVTITIASEIVYFAFLGARLIKLGELTDLVREMRAVRLQRSQVEKDLAQLSDRSSPRAKELSTQSESLNDVGRALGDRADVLWRQLGPIFNSRDSAATGVSQ
jgi:hypothetical protein